MKLEIGRDEGYFRIFQNNIDPEAVIRSVVSLVKRPPKTDFFSTWYIFILELERRKNNEIF
jgi:hypothetical protein